jgi:TatD DNase family protein
MVYSDSHVHLDSFPPIDLDIVFTQMKEQKVTLVLNVSINLATSAEAIKIAQTYDSVVAAIGIHPGEAIPLTADVKKQLENLSGQKRVVAFGEIGLSYGRSTGSKEEQQQLFLYQLSLANNLHIPIDIHYSYNSHQDIIGIIKEAKGSTGIVHGFEGSMSDLNDWLELGYYISLGMPMHSMPGGPPRPVLTDKVIRAIPEERLLTETDCMARMSVSRWKELGGPGQAQTPGNPPPDTKQGASKDIPPMQEEFRQPADVVGVAARIAKVRGTSTEEIGNVTTANLKRVLNIK